MDLRNSREFSTNQVSARNLVCILKLNWFSDSDASAFANAEASFNVIHYSITPLLLLPLNKLNKIQERFYEKKSNKTK